MDFKPDTVRALFGAEDAENETPQRLKEYFYRNRAYDSLLSSVPIRILVGHKGVGKSALLKMAHLEDNDQGITSIWLQPGDLSSLDGTYDERFDKAVAAWQAGLLRILYRRIEDSIGTSGGIPPDNIFLASTKDLATAIGRLANKYLEISSDDTSRAIISKFQKNNRINVYIDDLDRGWTGNKKDVQRISALLNALRDICGDYDGVQFRIGLRTDVYYLVRTSDESTDKITQYIIPLTWTNHDILVCMAKRVSTFLGEQVTDESLSRLPQSEVARHLHKIIDPIFHYHGKWENAPIHRVLLSLTRRRPRDLIKILAGAAHAAYSNNHLIITYEDLRSTFRGYSQDRLQDISNEFRSELPNISDLLISMRPTKHRRQDPKPFLYTNDQLSTKIRNILSSTSIYFSNGQPANYHTIRQFLYKIDFILARKENEHTGRPEWFYFEEDRIAASSAGDFGFSWEVHPAYRWALEKRDIQDVINGTDLIAP